MRIRVTRPALRGGLSTVAVLLLASVAGCAASSNGVTTTRPTATAIKVKATGGTAARVPLPNPATAPSLFLPIATYSLSPADAMLLDRARNIVLKNCMKKFGFSWTASAVHEITNYRDRRYGVTAADNVAVNGYHVPEEPPPPHPKLSRGEWLALIGSDVPGKNAADLAKLRSQQVPPGGCQGESQRAVDGAMNQTPAADAASDISATSYKNSMDDPAVRRVFAAWSRCMKIKGFSYPDPVRAGDAFTNPVASDVEKKVAVADVACKQQTNLVSVWFAVESRMQRTMIAPQKALLATILTRHEQQVARAKAVIAKG